jgi:NADPH:quinone reductase-like Zn-dependent oxidoreductase
MKTESMFAVYATKGDLQNPLAGLVVGERPSPEIPEGWVRVKVSHASLNRHDIFTLLGLTAQADPIVYPMIIGNDGAGTMDDGTEVAIYPVMGSDDWKGDETLDPRWHIFSEIVQGTFADFVVMPKRNARTISSCKSRQPDDLGGAAWGG